MDKGEQQKLIENLKKELDLIDKELLQISSESPLIKGDFDVRIDDIGTSPDDTAQEAGELDRLQAIVDNLERRRKEIVIALQKLENNNY
mgnify:CR=1 FL=1